MKRITLAQCRNRATATQERTGVNIEIVTHSGPGMMLRANGYTIARGLRTARAVMDALELFESSVWAVRRNDDTLGALVALREWVREPGEDDGPENDALIHRVDTAIERASH